LSVEEVAEFWSIRGVRGEKAVAGFDEDSLTMAVAAALDCMSRSPEEADGLYLATTTAPYREKQGAAIAASAIDLKKSSRTGDFTNSLRAGSLALRSAVDAVDSGSSGHIVVAASDCRLGAPKGKFEQLLGDGAAALTVGAGDTIADIEESYSVFNDFTDLWRMPQNDFIQSAENRFIGAAGYIPTMGDTISELMRKCSANPKDFAKVVFYATDIREHGTLSKNLGFEKDQIQEPMFAHIGNTGTAAAFLMLAAALEEAKSGDRILFAAYGDGCDAFVFRVTDHIGRIRTRPALKDKLAKKELIHYGKYLQWRSLVPVEGSTLPQRAEPSPVSRWRERRSVSALYGVRCKNCGTPQFHPIGQNIRVCAICQSKDNFEEYGFSNKKGKLFSYAIDQLQPTKNPPGLNGVVDFDGGGRLICELTDYELDKVRVGVPVEMTFRKMYQGRTIVNYFWKAKPIE
jgi:3-hydroxy-3-methylglutaryl CoA synthase/uncharacterized OB-fold protein